MARCLRFGVWRTGAGAARGPGSVAGLGSGRRSSIGTGVLDRALAAGLRRNFLGGPGLLRKNRDMTVALISGASF